MSLHIVLTAWESLGMIACDGADTITSAYSEPLRLVVAGTLIFTTLHQQKNAFIPHYMYMVIFQCHTLQCGCKSLQYLSRLHVHKISITRVTARTDDMNFSNCVHVNVHLRLFRRRRVEVVISPDQRNILRGSWFGCNWCQHCQLLIYQQNRWHLCWTMGHVPSGTTTCNTKQNIGYT